MTKNQLQYHPIKERKDRQTTLSRKTDESIPFSFTRIMPSDQARFVPESNYQFHWVLACT